MARHTAVDKSILEAALLGLEQQKAEIDAKTAEIRRRLRGLGSVGAPKAEAAPAAAPAGRTKRVLSPAARKRIAAATRKRWAAYRAAKSGAAAPAKKTAKRKATKKKGAPHGRADCDDLGLRAGNGPTKPLAAHQPICPTEKFNYLIRAIVNFQSATAYLVMGQVQPPALMLSVMVEVMTRREWLLSATALPLAAQSPDLDRFFQDFLEQWVRAEPETATAMRLFTGEEQDRLDSQLNDISDDAQHARIARARAGLAQLRRFDAARFSPDQRLSADMLQWLLTDVINEEPFLQYRFPLNQFGGVQVRLPSLLTDLHPMRTPVDAENYIARLGALAGKLDQASAGMRERAAQGIRPPAFILTETTEQMRRFMQPEPAANILVTSFAERVQKVDKLGPIQIAQLTARARRIVTDSVYPSYRRAIDGLTTISAKSGSDAGLWRLPRGAEAYAFYLHRYTTTDMTADQIHRQGLSEVARLESEMDGRLKKLGYAAGPIKDRMKKLEDDNCYPDGAGRARPCAGRLRRDAARRCRTLRGGLQPASAGALHRAADSGIPGGQCRRQLSGAAARRVASGRLPRALARAPLQPRRHAHAHLSRSHPGPSFSNRAAGGDD